MGRDRHSVCKRCEQEQRDKTKRGNRWLVKVDTTTRSHARRRGVTAAELRSQGWDRHHMAHDAEHAYANGCQHCRHAFSDMGHGLADLTLDIIDPERPAFYGVNTRWICATCNREKGATPPELWAETVLCHRRWEASQDNPVCPRLFEVA
jgi:hypothetical protein